VNALSAIDPLRSLSGFVVGLLVGLTGVGGGALMTPLLILLFGVHPATAVGTDLLYASITKSAGVAVHGWNRTVDWRVTGRLALGSIPATVLTLSALHVVGGAERFSALLSTMLGVALLLTASVVLLHQKILRLAGAHRGDLKPRRVAILTVATGAALGALVSLSSVGAGAVGASAIILLYPQLSMARIVGSDIAHAVPLTLVAGLGYWLMGSVDWLLLVSLILGSVPGIVVGSHMSARVPDRILRPILAAALAAVGSKLIL
jgi:uncharacterized membrane protein YfcA